MSQVFPTGNRRNRALFAGQKKNNFGSLFNCRCCTNRAQNLPGLALNISLTMFQISSKSVHLRRIIIIIFNLKTNKRNKI